VTDSWPEGGSAPARHPSSHAGVEGESAVALQIGRRNLLKATGGAAAAASLGAFSTSRAQEVTTLRMAWWGSETRHERTIAAFELFSQKYPDLRVTPEIATFDAQFDKLAVQTAGGNAPDVFQMSGQFILEYAARGALLDLNQFVPDVIDISSWDENAKNYGVIEGKMAGLPIGVDAYALVYDETVLGEAGLEIPSEDWTWEEFADFVTEVSEAKGEGFYGTGDAGGRYEPLETFVRQRGKTLFNDEGTGLGFEEEDLLDWFTYWDELRKSGAAAPAEVEAVGQDQEESPMIRGLAAMYWTTSSQFVNLQGLTEHQLGVHMHPRAEPDNPGSFIRPGLFISAYSETAHPNESAQLINFLLNDPEAAEILTTARGIPPSPEIRDLLRAEVSPEEQKGFAFIDLVNEVSTQTNRLTPPGGQQATDLLERTNQAVAFGQMTVQEGVDAFFAEAPSLLGV